MHLCPPVNCLILFVQFMPKSEYIDRNLLKIPNWKFHENTSDRSRIFHAMNKQTDRHDEANSCFSQMFLQGGEKSQSFV